MTRRWLLLVGKFAISALLLWFVLSRVHPSEIAARLRAADIRWLIPAFALAPIVIVLSAWRWRVLRLGLIKFGDAVSYTWIGLFFGSILPGVVGGDVAKGVSLAAKNPEARDPRLPISILVDKLVGFWVLLLLFNFVALGLLATQPQLLAGARGAVGLTGFVTFAGLLGGAALSSRRGQRFFQRLAAMLPFAPVRALATRLVKAVGSYVGRGRLLLKAALIGALIHALNAFGFWLTMHALAIPATPWFAAVFYALLSVFLALPISISGVGVRDVLAAGMFTAFSLNPESGVAFSWLQLGLTLPVALIGGIIQLREVFRRSHPHPIEPA
jgi:uncharacterized protein (TIRG00374 family)